MARVVVIDKDQKDVSFFSAKVAPCAHNIDAFLSSTMYTLGRAGVMT